MTTGSWRELGDLNTVRADSDEKLLVMKVRLIVRVSHFMNFL